VRTAVDTKAPAVHTGKRRRRQGLRLVIAWRSASGPGSHCSRITGSNNKQSNEGKGGWTVLLNRWGSTQYR